MPIQSRKPATVAGGPKRAAVLTNGNVFKQYYINPVPQQ
jgi:hypothetical protein